MTKDEFRAELARLAPVVRHRLTTTRRGAAGGMIFQERPDGEYYLGGTHHPHDAEMIVECVNFVLRLVEEHHRRR